jgi:hypothetical protein
VLIGEIAYIPRPGRGFTRVQPGNDLVSNILDAIEVLEAWLDVLCLFLPCLPGIFLVLLVAQYRVHDLDPLGYADLSTAYRLVAFLLTFIAIITFSFLDGWLCRHPLIA